MIANCKMCLPLLLAALGLGGSAVAADYNLRLLTDNGPDYTDLASFVQSATGVWESPQDKCIAVWRWGRRSRRQTSCAVEDGRLIWDPILHYNSYGAMNCGIISSLNLASFLQLGYRGRYIQLGDHTVSEVSWDDGRSWHLFDSSMSIFCFNHAGLVASCEEFQQSHACELSAGRSEPGHFYLRDDQGVALQAEDGSEPRLHPAQPATDAWVVFKIDAANVMTGMRIVAVGRRSGPEDQLSIAVSRDAGLHWLPVWDPSTTSASVLIRTLRDEVAGVTQCLVKLSMRAARQRQDAGWDSLQITTITQLNRRTLPHLTLGSNQILLRAVDQVETVELWPPLHAGLYQQTIVAEDGVSSAAQPDGVYKATLGAGVDGRDCSATWRLTVPREITRVTCGAISTNRSPSSSVSLQQSWDGSRFDEFHLNRDGDFPFDEQVIQDWSQGQVPAGSRQVFVRGVFRCRSGAATYNMPGIQDLLIRVCHQPRDATFQPLEVTYHWTEHRAEGDVSRSHTELVRSLPHRYVLNVAGRRDPTMHSVCLNVQGYGPEGTGTRYGYFDGTDVGPGWERPRVAYRWNQPLAVGKVYTASRPSSGESGNPDREGRELTNGVVIAPTDSTTVEAVQPATAFWDAGEPVSLVVDLQRAVTVAGVRVSTHQPNARYCHPAGIEVELSDDGKQWRSVGRLQHDDIFCPPGDYEAWEHDDSPQYADLPAAGRLAYSYPLAFDKPQRGRYIRFVCSPQANRGLGLSELAVYGQVTVTPWPHDIQL